MHTPSSQLRLIEFRQRRWVGSISDTEDIIHGIITIPVLHHSLTIRCKVHHLQTLTLLVVCIGCLRAITEFRIDRMTLFVVTYPVNNNAFIPLLIARKPIIIEEVQELGILIYSSIRVLCQNYFFFLLNYLLPELYVDSTLKK